MKKQTSLTRQTNQVICFFARGKCIEQTNNNKTHANTHNMKGKEREEILRIQHIQEVASAPFAMLNPSGNSLSQVAQEMSKYFLL